MQDAVRGEKQDSRRLGGLKYDPAFSGSFPDQNITEDPVFIGVRQKSTAAPDIFLHGMDTSVDHYADLSCIDFGGRDELIFFILLFNTSQAVHKCGAVRKGDALEHRVLLKSPDH